MREIRGNIWHLPADARVITTNGMIKKDGNAVMGKGIALQASQKYPNLSKDLALKLKDNGNHTFFFPPDIITFPTKENWRDASIISLIERSSRELKELANKYNLKNILLPPPGCGLGGLKWNDVKIVIAPFLDERFTVVHYQK